MQGLPDSPFQPVTHSLAHSLIHSLLLNHSLPPCLPAPLPACLQGRGLATHAYTHSLETAHHMFMKLDNGKVGFCYTSWLQACRQGT